MERVKWLLGTHFLWSVTPTAVNIHLSQTGFASHLVEDNNVHHCNITPGATLIAPVNPSRRVPSRTKTMNPPHSLTDDASTKALLVPLVGSPRAHALTLRHPIPSCLLIIISPRGAIWMRHFMCFTTFTPPLTMDSSSRPNFSQVRPQSQHGIWHLKMKNIS